MERRQRIQQEATAGALILSLERKRLEQQRQLDLQRQEIHPSHVQATLQALQEKQPPSYPSSPNRTGFLPPAVPATDPKRRPPVHLPPPNRRTAPPPGPCCAYYPPAAPPPPTLPTALH